MLFLTILAPTSVQPFHQYSLETFSFSTFWIHFTCSMNIGKTVITKLNIIRVLISDSPSLYLMYLLHFQNLLSSVTCNKLLVASLYSSSEPRSRTCFWTLLEIKYQHGHNHEDVFIFNSFLALSHNLLGYIYWRKLICPLVFCCPNTSFMFWLMHIVGVTSMQHIWPNAVFAQLLELAPSVFNEASRW